MPVTVVVPWQSECWKGKYNMTHTTLTSLDLENLESTAKTGFAHPADVLKLVAEVVRLRDVLLRIKERFEAADEGTLHVRDGVAWAMWEDACSALESQ